MLDEENTEDVAAGGARYTGAWSGESESYTVTQRLLTTLCFSPGDMFHVSHLCIDSCVLARPLSIWIDPFNLFGIYLAYLSQRPPSNALIAFLSRLFLLHRLCPVPDKPPIWVVANLDHPIPRIYSTMAHPRRR